MLFRSVEAALAQRRAAFRETLRKSGFYKNWQGKFGDEAWKLLQDSVGSLG